MTSVSCSCVSNKSGKCKHIAALIYYINNEESLSKTDHEQLWGKPTARQMAKLKYSKGKYFYEMFPPIEKVQKVEPYSISITELEESCALKTILVTAAKNESDECIRILVSSMLKTVEKNLQKEESDAGCEACLCNFRMFCIEQPVYSNTRSLGDNTKDFYEKNI